MYLQYLLLLLRGYQSDYIRAFLFDLLNQVFEGTFPSAVTWWVRLSHEFGSTQFSP